MRQVQRQLDLYRILLDLPACFYHDVSGQATLGYRENTASRLLYGSLNISFKRADLHEKGPLFGSKRKEVIESVIKTVH